MLWQKFKRDNLSTSRNSNHECSPFESNRLYISISVYLYSVVESEKTSNFMELLKTLILG